MLSKDRRAQSSTKGATNATHVSINAVPKVESSTKANSFRPLRVADITTMYDGDKMKDKAKGADHLILIVGAGKHSPWESPR